MGAMSSSVPPAKLREYMAYFLQGAVKEYEIEAVCDRLGMPSAGDGAWSYNSKRVYVQNRLAGASTEEVLRIAHALVDEFGDEELEAMLGAGGFRGVDGDLKNLIFAAVGVKPRIVLRDAINNVIEIVEGADRCLVYDRPLPRSGLTWGVLLDWWRASNATSTERLEAEALYRRLHESLESPPEKVLFRTFCQRYAGDRGRDVPALIPQVYLHYSPYTKRELRTFAGKELPRQRMDFLLLPSDRMRVVIEVDGRQHYAEDDGSASTARYAAMMREDRSLRLDGYEVYRFGGLDFSAMPGSDSWRISSIGCLPPTEAPIKGIPWLPLRRFGGTPIWCRYDVDAAVCSPWRNTCDRRRIRAPTSGWLFAAFRGQSGRRLDVWDRRDLAPSDVESEVHNPRQISRPLCRAFGSREWEACRIEPRKNRSAQ
jgi:hypothetical protein